MRRQLLLTSLGLVAMLCLMPQATKADTITFNPLELPGSDFTFVASYTELGFTFTSATGGGFGSAQQGNAAFYAGSAGLFNISLGSFTVLSQGGTGFSLNSIDLSQLSMIATGTINLTFTGFFVGGGTTVQTFSFNQFGFQTFTFNPTFTNLASVDFPQIFPGFQFDNVVVNESNGTVIPEPTTMLLLGTGLLGVAARVGRHRRRM